MTRDRARAGWLDRCTRRQWNGAERGREPPIERERIREYALTAGELGGAAAQTTMVVLLPVLLRDDAPSAFWLGFAVAGEGIFALLMPFVIGRLSDRLPPGLARRFGRRSLFLLLAAPAMAAAIALTPFIGGYWPTVALAFLFFAAFHTYTTPLWTLMVDAVPDERRASVQGVRGALHSAGLAYGLVGGGVLYSIWAPLPFLIAAPLLLGSAAATVITARGFRRRNDEPIRTEAGSLREFARELRDNPSARWLLTANGLWNGAIDGIRPYIFVFAAVVIGVSTAVTSAILVFLVIGLGIGSVIAGRLGDRWDRRTMLSWGSGLTALAFLAGFFMRDLWVASALLLVAGVGASTIIALPYPLYASLTSDRHAGENTGVFVVSVGLGRLFSPLLVGAAIDFGERFMPELEGYPFMWLVAAALALLGLLALRGVHERRGAERA